MADTNHFSLDILHATVDHLNNEISFLLVSTPREISGTYMSKMILYGVNSVLN